MQEHAYFTCHNGVIGEMFVGAEKADKVNQGELIYPVVAICPEDCVVPHIDNEIENQHNAVFYAFKSLRFCRLNVGVSFDEVRGIVFYALNKKIIANSVSIKSIPIFFHYVSMENGPQLH